MFSLVGEEHDPARLQLSLKDDRVIVQESRSAVEVGILPSMHQVSRQMRAGSKREYQVTRFEVVANHNRPVRSFIMLTVSSR